MKYLPFIYILALLVGCSKEGVDLSDEQLNTWFSENEQDLNQIVDVFKENKCLRRVEHDSTDGIEQHCESKNNKNDINRVQAQLKKINVIGARGGISESTGEFSADILIYRHRKHSSRLSHALTLLYDINHEGDFSGRLGCVMFPVKGNNGWYFWHQDAPVECN